MSPFVPTACASADLPGTLHPRQGHLLLGKGAAVAWQPAWQGLLSPDWRLQTAQLFYGSESGTALLHQVNAVLSQLSQGWQNLPKSLCRNVCALVDLGRGPGAHTPDRRPVSNGGAGSPQPVFSFSLLNAPRCPTSRLDGAVGALGWLRPLGSC